jgi:hypothetical protein
MRGSRVRIPAYPGKKSALRSIRSRSDAHDLLRRPEGSRPRGAPARLERRRIPSAQGIYDLPFVIGRLRLKSFHSYDQHSAGGLRECCLPRARMLRGGPCGHAESKESHGVFELRKWFRAHAQCGSGVIVYADTTPTLLIASMTSGRASTANQRLCHSAARFGSGGNLYFWTSMSASIR